MYCHYIPLSAARDGGASAFFASIHKETRQDYAENVGGGCVSLMKAPKFHSNERPIDDFHAAPSAIRGEGLRWLAGEWRMKSAYSLLLELRDWSAAGKSPSKVPLSPLRNETAKWGTRCEFLVALFAPLAGSDRKCTCHGHALRVRGHPRQQHP